MKTTKCFFAAVACCLLAVLAFSGCRSTQKTKIAIELESTPSTGYEWVAEIRGDAKFISSETVNAASGLAGAPQTRRYVFEPLAAGDLTVIFTYKRDWKGGETAYSVTYQFTVDETLHAAFVSKTPKAVDGSVEGVEFPDPVIDP